MTAHRSPEERKSDGKKLREAVSRSSHGVWSPADDRPDPVEVITSQDAEQSVAGYRQAMATVASQPTLDVSYAQATLDQIAASAPKKKDRKRIWK